MTRPDRTTLGSSNSLRESSIREQEESGDEEQHQLTPSAPQSHNADRRNGGVAFADSDSASQPRIPAAGAGTRTVPRAAPRSSSSLRHVSSAKARTTGFIQPLIEDHTVSGYLQSSSHDPTTSTVAKHVDKEKRLAALHMRQDTGPLADSDAEDDDNDDYGDDLDDNKRHVTNHNVAFQQGRAEVGGQFDYFSRGTSSTHHSKSRSRIFRSKLANGPVQSSSTSASDDSDDWDTERLSLPAHMAASRSLATLDEHYNSTTDPGFGVAPTPGPSFPIDLHTPADIGEVETPVLNPQQRMEWQIMLESVLNSEVLKSETKRINSVDTPDLTRQQISYQRWLDIKATLRGRGLHRGAVDEEEKRLKQGFGKMLRELVGEIKDCRAQHIAVTDNPTSQSEDESIATESTSTAQDESTDQSPSLLNLENGLHEDKADVLTQIGSLLSRIDSAEEQFPSTKKAIEIVPEWGDSELRAKLAVLYSWYNVTTSLRLQISILQKWTGSETLEIASLATKHGASNSHDDSHGHGQTEQQPRARRPAADDDSTFIERIQKEGSLQSTFEKRTLSSLYQLIAKAKDTLLHHHADFKRMRLPSFEPELITLINFPTRLMQGALRLRLDHAGKLAEPSVLIVDSLTDDLRAALAMACRVKLQYSGIIVSDPQRGWDLPPCISDGYDSVLRQALKFFFKLLRLKLKASIYFKETEILEPEWRFLSTAVESIEGGDIIVATNITRFVNKLFDRIAHYFTRELTATITQYDQHTRRVPNPVSGPVSLHKQDQTPNFTSSAAAGRITAGKVNMSIEERAKWIHSVFDSVRIRSRKLLGFSRDIRNRLDNAAEYDLGTLRASSEYHDESTRSEGGDGLNHNQMTLSDFMLTLIDHDYFLVYTETLEENGIYLIAEPALHDKPDLIHDLVCKCLQRVRPGEEDTAMAAEATANAINSDGDDGTEEKAQVNVLREQIEKQTKSMRTDDDERPRYILLLSPRDPFMWTGKVMHHVMPRADISLADRRLRLVADGPKSRLELCKRHFESVFAQGSGEVDGPSDDGHGNFPLDILVDQMAHMARVQSGLEDINKGVYMLSDTIIRKVPEIRRRLRRKSGRSQTNRTISREILPDTLNGGSDELIQNCYAMAAEHGRRALPFIESARLRDQMTLALGRLAIDWIAFICDDCVPSERKTFRWAVSALGNANYVTSSENIFRLNEQDFTMLRSKVGACMALLISHFDILGARSSVAKAQEEQERGERDKTDRNRITAANTDPSQLPTEDFRALRIPGSGEEGQSQLSVALGPGMGAQTRCNKLDTAIQATEDRRVQKMLEWDAARSEIEAEQRIIGRVLDDTRLEDRSLQFLAQSASKITIRWQQGQFIGGGTFGTVYLAVNLDSGGLMAVKEIRFQDISSSPTLYQQIKDEMEVMSMLSHPNIVEYFGIEVHRDRVYIFEEYCQGGSLAALLEHGRIEDETVIQVYTLQMVEGLIYLHSQGIIHRDIKPDNILLDHMGVLKFVDFGAAKILAKNSRTIQRSRKSGPMGGMGMLAAGGEGGKQGGPAGAMASLQGTPMYMSPEVIKGTSDGPQFAADIWSLGCVVLEFATGKRPWSNFDNEWAIMFHIGMAEQHPALPDSSQLSDLGINFIRQCLTISPRQRPSAIQLKEDPWMRNLIEELDAANEAEAAAEMANAPGERMDEESYSSGSLDSAHMGNPFASGQPATPSVGGAAFKSLDRNVSSLNSLRSKWSNEGSSSPSGGTNMNTPYNPSLSLNASLSYRQQQIMQNRLQNNDQNPPSEPLDPATAGSELASEPGDESTAAAEVDANEAAAVHVPGHPNHAHPGSSALFADLQYQKEAHQRQAMLRNDSEFSAITDDP